MKQLIIISQAILTLSFLSGCVSQNITPPSQNNALNSISKSTAEQEKKGIMQESLDSWIQDDWLPTIEKNKKIQEDYMEVKKVNSSPSNNSHLQNDDKKIKKSTSAPVYVEKEDKPFTLQEYVDKAEAYMHEKPNNYEESNVKKLESLPAIGK